MTKQNYSLAVDASGHLWACQPDSADDARVRREADEILAEGGRAPEYTVHRGVTLTDAPSGTMVFTATEDNALVDDTGQDWRFAVL